MGNSCCGPRNENKIKAETLKKSLLDEKIILTKDNKFRIVQASTIENTNSNEEIIVYNRSENQIISCLNPQNNHSEKETQCFQKGSKLNEKELRFDEAKGSLLVINQELVSEQRKVVAHIMKEISLNFLKGKSLMDVSFPVQIFEPKSVLQRLASTFLYAPNFLNRAGETKDPLDQTKLVIAFIVAGVHLNISQRKPFNPILGETFQGIIGDSQIYLEQICHHPPISYFYLLGKKYKFYGSFELSASQGFNSVKGRQIGVPKLLLPENNNLIRLQTPNALLKNILVGTREFGITDFAYVYSDKNKIFAQLKFKCDANNSLKFEGKIIKAKEHLFKKIEESIKKNNEIANGVYDSNQDVEEKICTVEGDWGSYLNIDGKKYWDINEDHLYFLKNEPNPLPSDSKFRLDMTYLEKIDFENAQKEKENLENLQRRDKKLRESKK